MLVVRARGRRRLRPRHPLLAPDAAVAPPERPRQSFQRSSSVSKRSSTKSEGDEPFLELLAADALDVARTVAPETVAPNTTLMAWLGVGVASLAVLVWLVVGEARVRRLRRTSALDRAHGERGAADRASGQLRETRRSAATPISSITAQTRGLLTPQIVLYARYQSAAKWEQVTMQPRSGASGYQFVLTGVPENVEYYVEAGPRRSRHFNIRVVDLASVKQIKVTYHYPSWTGLKDSSEDAAAICGRSKARAPISTS